MGFLTQFWAHGYLDQLVTGFATWAILLTLAACIVILTKGADLLVGGAASLARLTHLPEIIIGATIISLGTTLPEVFVSVLSAWTGNPGLALGNGIGSIICNTGLILGITCVLARVPVDHFILKRTGFVLFGASTLLVLFGVQACIDSPNVPVLHRWVGVVFLILLVVYLYLSYKWSQSSAFSDADDQTVSPGGILTAFLHVAIGLLGVWLGSRLLIPCAAMAATRIGVPQDVVAATLVSFGTSLPELVTAVAAVRSGHPQIMVGNVIGASILSCLLVIGAASLAGPLQVTPNFFHIHFPVMLLIIYSFMFFVFINRDGWFKRVQGAWILGIYLAYLVVQYHFAL